MNCVDKIKRRLKCVDEIKKIVGHCPKVKIIQIKWDKPKINNNANSIERKK